jgi:hypothetical protein
VTVFCPPYSPLLVFTVGLHEFGSEPIPAPKKMNSDLVIEILSKRFAQVLGAMIAGAGMARGDTLTTLIHVVVFPGAKTVLCPVPVVSEPWNSTNLQHFGVRNSRRIQSS